MKNNTCEQSKRGLAIELSEILSKEPRLSGVTLNLAINLAAALKARAVSHCQPCEKQLTFDFYSV